MGYREIKAQLACALILAGSVVANAQAFNGTLQEIVISPAQPQAYQAFDITFIAWGLPKYPMTVHVEDGTLILEYISYREDFATKAPPNTALTATVSGLPAGVYPGKLVRRLHPDEREEEISDWSVTVEAAPDSIPVHSFYNRETGHYFITASNAERDGIFNGAAGNAS